MSISFHCDRCGKAFDVDDKLAGKKGRCKECGAVMQIPASEASRRSETISRDDTAAEISPSRRAPALKATPPPVEDVYGFEDAPSPPRSQVSTIEGESAPIARARAKKSAGFFSSGPRPKKALYPGGPTLGGAFRRVGIGIIAGAAGLFVKMVILPALNLGGDPNWASRGTIEGYLTSEIAEVKALTATLETVHDVPTAEAASATANAAIRKLAEHLRTHKDRKRKRADINEMKAKYAAEVSRAGRNFGEALLRLRDQPETWDALAIQGAMEELAAASPDESVALNSTLRPPPAIGPRPFANPALMPPTPTIPQPGANPRPPIGPPHFPRPGGMGPGFPRRNRGGSPVGVPPQ